jgi:HEAT repeat protein
VAKDEPTESGTFALIEKLKDDDVVVVAEASNGLVARRATSAISALADKDIHRPDGIAPSIIDALGRLGGMAAGDVRRTAVDRLVALMRSEKLRGAADSPGNLLQIYEALGATEDSRAAPPLETELEDASVGVAPKVVIVQALAEIGAPSSRTVVARTRPTVVATAPRDAFEAELRKDLLAAIDAALTTLP